MSDKRRRAYDSSRNNTSSRSTSRSAASASRTGNSRSSAGRTSSTATRANPYKPSSKSIVNLIIGVLIVALVLVGVTGALIYSNIKYLYDETKIVPGIYVSGVDVGGMTREQAFNELSQELSNRTNALNVTLNLNGQSWNYDATNIQTSGDITTALDQVILYGHVGTVKERMAEAEYVLQNEETLAISFGFDEVSIRQIIETLKVDLDVPAQEPSLEFDDTAGKITNVDDTVSLKYNPLKYDSEISINNAPITVLMDANGNPTVEKTMNSEGLTVDNDIFTITEGADGYVVDVDATVAAIMTDLADDYNANVDIITAVASPGLTETDLQQFTSLIYHSKTKLTSSSTTERDHNIATALGSFDGLVLYPGDIVSFNETTGERNELNGYQEAPGIAQDKSIELVYGGGVCQAATTIFNAVLMSGCKILERNSHSWPSYYESYNFGQEARDAMVNWGTSDVVFQNTTDYPIYFDTYVHWTNPAKTNASWGYCNVYSKLLPEGQYYECQSVNLKNDPPPDPVYEALTDFALYADKDWSLDPATGLMVFAYNKPKNEKVYEVYRYTMDVVGTEVFKEKMYLAHYKAIQGKYFTKPVDAPVPPAETAAPTE